MLAGGFSPRKANLSFYVGDKFDGAQALYNQLGKHKKSVACLYINKLADVDLGIYHTKRTAVLLENNSTAGWEPY